MKRLPAIFSILLTAAALTAAENNLVQNADFAVLKGRTAEHWANVGKLAIAFQAKDGVRPDCGKVTLTAAPEGDAAARTGSIRQKLTTVRPGQTVRITASFKADNFSASDYGVLIINRFWKGSVGIRRFNPPDGKWVKRSKVVTVPDGWSELQLVFFAADAKGSLSLSDLTVEPAGN